MNYAAARGDDFPPFSRDHSIRLPPHQPWVCWSLPWLEWYYWHCMSATIPSCSPFIEWRPFYFLCFVVILILWRPHSLTFQHNPTPFWSKPTRSQFFKRLQRVVFEKSKRGAIAMVTIVWESCGVGLRNLQPSCIRRREHNEANTPTSHPILISREVSRSQMSHRNQDYRKTLIPRLFEGPFVD